MIRCRPLLTLALGLLLLAESRILGGHAESDAPKAALGDVWSDINNPIRTWFPDNRLEIWSLKPRTRPEIPVPSRVMDAPNSDPTHPTHPDRFNSHASIPQNPIDLFIHSHLVDQGLVPSPQTDKRTWIRRVFLDVIGLPPTPEQVFQFVNDTSEDARERVVDFLLASPHYGEHQARWWLDVVRYSDSNGFDWDEFRPEAWRYRDYVIRSFNQDKAYDQFIREQLAGDELLTGPPKSVEEQDALIATGYLRIGPQDNSAPLFNEQARARAEMLADLTETTGTAFLGLTLECCRCHNHKTEPISQADHFRFRAFFAGVRDGDDLPLDLADDHKSIQSFNAELKRQVQELEQQRNGLQESLKALWVQKMRGSWEAADRALMEADPETLSASEQARRQELESALEPGEKDLLETANATQKTQWETWQQSIKELQARRKAWTRGLLMTDASGDPPVQRIHYQGNPAHERDAVEPGIPSVWNPNPMAIGRSANSETTGRRWTLAQWIAHADNPLTARVLVNRVWQQFFGVGLVATPNDFGTSGQPPTHPDLLDWLANQFVEDRWSVKKLQRRILLSNTYGRISQQTSNSDQDTANRWLSRQNLRRLSAEQLRDSLLAVSGLLRPHIGGPPVWPELPADVLRANPAFLDDNSEKTKGWYPSPVEARPVRTIYWIQKRTVRHPFLETFDLPDNSKSCAQRERSTVAPQAFSLLNDPEMVQIAHALAERTLQETEPHDSIPRLFQLALQRDPSSTELRACQEFLSKHSLPALARAVLNLNEFLYID